MPFPMFVIDSGIPIKKFYFVYSVPIGNALRKLPKCLDGGRSLGSQTTLLLLETP